MAIEILNTVGAALSNMTVFEVLNWVGMTLATSAFFVKNVFWLRTMSSIGCMLLLTYYSQVGNIPAIIGNTIVLLANSYFLIVMYRNRELHGISRRMKVLVRKGRIGIKLKRKNPTHTQED